MGDKAQRLNHLILLTFLNAAHRDTYASGTKVHLVNNSHPQHRGHKIYYSILKTDSGNWEYYDEFTGKDYHTGREVVMFDGEPVWSMSYRGRLIVPSRKVGEEEIIPFLKEALRAAPETRPIRGPDNHTNKNGLEYIFNIDGGYQWFKGHEIIMRHGRVAFQQDVIGGLIK